MALHYYKITFLTALVMGLGACATPYPENLHGNQSEKAVAEQPLAVVAPIVTITNEEIFSNPNVIVYPVTGDLSQSKRAFAKYRGVLENTTAGGYTVFDPSVTVYAVEGQGLKPAYLPEYSVPEFAQNYTPHSMVPTGNAAMPPMPLAYQDDYDPYVPDEMSMKPRVPSSWGATIPVEENFGALPVRNVEQRRSLPVLTGYD